MLPLCSFLVRSLSFSRGFSSTPSVPSTIRALIYQGSVHGNNLHVFFPEYGFSVTRFGVMHSDRPLNRIELPLNESESYEVETEVFERELSDEKVESIVQRILKHNKEKEDIKNELDQIKERLGDLTNESKRLALQADVKNFLESFGDVPTGLERQMGPLF